MENYLTDKSLLAERILSRMKSVLGVTMDKDVAAYFDIKQASVHNWRKRGTVPYDQCVQLAMDKGISLDWLIIGRDSDGQVDSFPVAQDVDYTEVPLYDVEASAGNGSFFSHERVISYIKFRNDWLAREGLHAKDLASIRVSGDSMDGTLSDGDTVLIDCSRKKPDGVFAIRIGDALRIKRLQTMADGSLRVSSDNALYQPETIHPENFGNIEIVGLCYWRAGRVF
ncbi:MULTISPECIES: S24 family peptidase [Marinobacter]|jgi:phage repressor protein C with HTH and peptisase S24 domain|uniref:Peptidase S24-like protein n=1 Tax=Marinobacter nauticus TaxID=2743 RepID=A0A368VFP2_MARNT|nr:MULTISPECIES: LexA family transcriptional regulator [Marinobacter]RBP76985.1 peptidase S24-like protein [Marinobacter nauticus]RCW37831.1 peptidase S24-like protein [Marinobacter nauticus]ROQ39343.1 peptidase S24-like protein [Marinobacter sp. 3-2]